jgi:hypothetical protein
MRTFAVLTLGLVLAAASLVPASASATSRDIASTHAYIQANFALARASERRLASTQASIERRTRQFGRECPGVGVGSAQDEEAQKLSYEAVGAVWSISYGAVAGPIRAFARAVKPLRWSNAKLTRIAQGYAQALRQLAALPLPDLCGDARAWRASGFRTVPATTLRFDAHVESIEGHSIPARLLAPYEQPGDRGALARTTRLEADLEHLEFEAGVEDWMALLDAVGLKQ